MKRTAVLACAVATAASLALADLAFASANRGGAPKVDEPAVGERADAQDADEAGTGAAQQRPSVHPPGVLPPDTSAAAAAAWRAMLGAVVRREGTADAGGDGVDATAPITDRFDMNLGLLTRSGRRGTDPHPETHEFDTRVLYMDVPPYYSFVRYQLPEGVESGFGPDGFWLRDGTDLVSLQGREYETDREQIKQVVSLCRNFLAISTPNQLSLAKLEKLPRMPFDPGELPQRPGVDPRRLVWLSAITPDFRLVEAIQPKIADQKEEPKAPLYRVLFGLDARTHLPRMLHVVRLDANPRAMIFEQLIMLEEWAASRDDRGRSVLLPHRLYVHERLPSHPHFRHFLADPDREVYVREGSSLFPNLTEADFDPKPQ